ncbi:MAG: DUF177 domain-containing protein [Desulfobulbaceae bacterium]|nr:DUF177 domain-containing protein [Desulfobulbaceae bacterium]
MQIKFTEISPYGSSYEVQRLESLVTQKDFVVKSPFSAQCTLKRKGDSKVEMHGRLKTCISLPCDRCLATYDVAIDTEYQILFETGSSDSWKVKELECTLPDLDSIVLDEPVIDLDDVLRQQLYLSLPVKSLCSEQCKGICPQCGVNRNLAECNCANETPVGPFAALVQLKK